MLSRLFNLMTYLLNSFFSFVAAKAGLWHVEAYAVASCAVVAYDTRYATIYYTHLFSTSLLHIPPPHPSNLPHPSHPLPHTLVLHPAPLNLDEHLALLSSPLLSQVCSQVRGYVVAVQMADANKNLQPATPGKPGLPSSPPLPPSLSLLSLLPPSLPPSRPCVCVGRG